MKIIYTNLVIACLLSFGLVQSIPAQEKKPKNIILLIGDGMGLSAVSTSILTDSSSAFRKFRFIGLSITCSADNLITDSAAGATALSSGERTNNHYVGVDPKGKVLENIFEIAEDHKYSTGLVVTCSITHATPAAFYAHVPERGDEFKIAEQFLTSGIDVAIGAGRNFFLPESEKGQRKDNLDLITSLEEKDYKYITNVKDLESYSGSEKILALLEDGSLPDADKRNYSLGDLTKAGLKNLSKNKNGFILMVEGSQIDWGEHDNIPAKTLSEVKDFNEAINEALVFAEKDENTLVIVTADHETGGTSITGGDFNKQLTLGYASKGHTAACVGIFAYGPSADMFQGVLENRQIGKNLIKLINSKQASK